ncbi:YutD family protein [Paenibacillus sp. IHBB 10380]|uniref:YutD family protein n=1 Tax=Paenibacillus sp. IHBB 10380 TaxID=1566358 RepID=UPI0005CFB14D
MILVGGKNYEILKDHKSGWNPEAFRGRYSDVLERYDYIIGDWGYSQLRLKGFYRDNHPKANKETAISSMEDYINEYCNFGCAFFVLQKSREPVLKDKETNIPKEDTNVPNEEINVPNEEINILKEEETSSP